MAVALGADAKQQHPGATIDGMTSEGADDEGRHASVAAALHELNNVLSAILGYAEIVHADAQSGEVEERDARQILAAARRAIELARDVAALSAAAEAQPSGEAGAGSEPGGAA